MTDARTFATEFPDFPAAAVPAVVRAPGWSDASWGRDMCPLFVHEASGVAVWTAFPGDGEPRFTAVALTWGGEHGWQHNAEQGCDLPLFEADDESTLAASLPNFTRPRAIAHAFALQIEAEPFIADVRRLNAVALPGTCATHDFCDANMPMAAAFAQIVGRDADPADESDAALWSQAWDIATRERLTDATAADPIPATLARLAEGFEAERTRVDLSSLHGQADGLALQINGERYIVAMMRDDA